MKKFILLLILAAFLSPINLYAKEIKRPDTYAYTRGVEAYLNEDFQEAFDWLNRELQENPENGYAHVYMGFLRYYNNEYGRALNELEAALKHIPKKDKEWQALTYSDRADVYIAMEDTVSALKDLAQAIKLDSKNPKLYEKRAQIYFEQKNYPLADADYDQMISLQPGHVMGYMGKGRNAKNQDRWNEALEYFNLVTKLEPDYSSGYSFRAEAFMALEKWSEAADDIIKALDIDGNEKAFYLTNNFPEEASGILKTKLKIQMAKQPNEALWPYCIAGYYSNNENYEESIEYLIKANNINANSIFLEQIAKSYQELNQYAKALTYAEQALAMDPENYDLIQLKAQILANLGRFDECLIEWDKVIARYPDDVFAYLSRAGDLMAAHRFKEAVDDYNVAFAIFPGLEESPYFLILRGDAYRLSGREDLAIIDYNNVLVAEKDSILSSASRAPFAYSGLGENDKAVETMRFMVDNFPEDIEGNLYDLACIYTRVGRREDAVNALRMAIEKGYNELGHIKTDYDLDGIRNLPEFISLINSMEKLYSNGEQDPAEEFSYETVEIPFTKEGGVTKVQCTINGLPLHFVFDTGAADVTMSLVEANFMLKNDYIKPTDIMGSSRYIDANGDISEGTVINLRNVNFGGLELDNVRAAVVRNQRAPLLLGQSVLGRLGKIEIDNAASKLKITHRVK